MTVFRRQGCVLYNKKSRPTTVQLTPIATQMLNSHVMSLAIVSQQHS